jgi:hypothetical protein
MTEHEWQTCSDPFPMLELLLGKTTERKSRLFARACLLRLWERLSDERSRTAVETLDRYAEGLVDVAALAAAHARAWEASRAMASEADDWTVADGRYTPQAFAAGAVVEATASSAEEQTWLYFGQSVPVCVAMSVYNAECAALDDPAQQQTEAATLPAPPRKPLADLVRCVFANPFRPLSPRPAAIGPLAEEIYAGRWDLMPLLGEWLQEHGFWAEGEHCLDRVQHVKGCDIVDWLTGRD